MLSEADKRHIEHHGWVRIAGAVPQDLCAALVEVLRRELRVPVDESARWPDHGGPMRDLIPIWGHQAIWDIRQLPNMHAIWSALWGTEALFVSLDSCRFTPPWRQGFAEPLPLHWDHDPNAERQSMFQGVVALTATEPEQGGFRCVPALFRDRAAWPKRPVVVDGDEEWIVDTGGREIVHVPAAAGDLIVWNSRLPHGNSKNLSARPRIAFYIQMFPAGDEEHRRNAVESWRTGRCVPWWRSRPGYDRSEPWPPAQLTPLGRRLVGLDPWPTN